MANYIIKHRSFIAAVWCLEVEISKWCIYLQSSIFTAETFYAESSNHSMRAENSFYLAFSAKSSAFVLHRDFALRGWTSQYSKKYLLIKSPIEMKHIFSDTNQISHCAMNKFRYFHQFGRNVCFEAVVCNLQIISTKHWGTPQWTFLLSVMKENFYKQPLHRLCIGRCHSSEPHFALHSEAINTNICQERLFGIKKWKRRQATFWLVHYRKPLWKLV